MASRRRLPGLLAPMAALSLAFVAASCGADGTDASPASPVQAPVPTVDGVDAAPAALQFTAPLVGGGSFHGSAHGDRPVAFWFWAPT